MLAHVPATEWELVRFASSSKQVIGEECRIIILPKAYLPLVACLHRQVPP